MTETSASYAPERAGELRDTERAIALWHQKAAQYGRVPPLSAFDFSRMAVDWGYRFLIVADTLGSDHTFLLYGLQFAQLLELPETPVSGVPLANQLPRRYLPLFREGCDEAIAQSVPVRMSGAVTRDYGVLELYRAAFMPLAQQAPLSTPLVFGSFNRRIGPKITAADAFRLVHNWVAERSNDSAPLQ